MIDLKPLRESCTEELAKTIQEQNELKGRLAVVNEKRQNLETRLRVYGEIGKQIKAANRAQEQQEGRRSPWRFWRGFGRKPVAS